MHGQNRVFRWGEIFLLGFSPFVIGVGQPEAIAAIIPSCPIPTTVPDQITVVNSFLNQQCTQVALTEDTTFFRFYNTDESVRRFGRFVTSTLFKTNIEAIVFLALAPFPGGQNFAQQISQVTFTSGTVVYQGSAGPQPPDLCYPGGGQQTFIEDSRPFTFIPIGQPTQLPLTSCPSQSLPIPESSPLAGVGAIAILGLAAAGYRTYSKPKVPSVAQTDRVSV